MEWLLDLDRDLLLGLNGAHNGFLDSVMWWLSNKYVWIPAYAALLYGLYRHYGWKEALLIGVGAGLVILVADQGASGVLKPWIERPRPCHDPEIGHLVHRVYNKCGGPFGFVSSHAANFFGLATYLFFFFRDRWKWAGLIFFSCAFLVALSRVYLGVHYPGDILFGGMLGVFAGILVRFIYLRFHTRILS
ncbi:MAG: phosphatase PAP2 family protein [Bacteroidota bacterium]